MFFALHGVGTSYFQPQIPNHSDATMRVPLTSTVILLAAGVAHAASSSWSFDDGSVSIVSKKDPEAGAGAEKKYAHWP